MIKTLIFFKIILLAFNTIIPVSFLLVLVLQDTWTYEVQQNGRIPGIKSEYKLSSKSIKTEVVFTKTEKNNDKH